MNPQKNRYSRKSCQCNAPTAMCLLSRAGWWLAGGCKNWQSLVHVRNVLRARQPGAAHIAPHATPETWHMQQRLGYYAEQAALPHMCGLACALSLNLRRADRRTGNLVNDSNDLAKCMLCKMLDRSRYICSQHHLIGPTCSGAVVLLDTTLLDAPMGPSEPHQLRLKV